jgi:hypothetical protein
MLQFQLMNPQERQTPGKNPAKQPAQPGPPATDTLSPKSWLGIAGLVLAILTPPIGLIVSIIAWRQIKKKSLRGKKLAIFGTIWGLIFSLPFLFLLWLFIIFGGFKSNGAQGAAKPFLVKVEQLGGKKICDNGDSGYGIDNNQPWYEVYYQIPDSPGLTDEIKGIANQEGYHLVKDSTAISQLQSQSDTALPGDDQFSSQADYLTGHNGNKILTVAINRQTSVALNCKSGQYGRKQATGNDAAILDINFQLPATNQ